MDTKPADKINIPKIRADGKCRYHRSQQPKQKNFTAKIQTKPTKIKPKYTKVSQKSRANSIELKSSD